MKNNGIKNLKVFAVGLCLSATLLVGCNEKNITVGKSKIVYDSENNTIEGNVTFEDLNKYGKVVILEENDEVFSRLLLKKEGTYLGKYSYSSYDYKKYIDLETGALLIAYNDYHSSGEREWITGQHLNITMEMSITSYLVNNNFVKTDYTIEELISFFEESVIPTLNNNEKEMVK